MDYLRGQLQGLQVLNRTGRPWGQRGFYSPPKDLTPPWEGFRGFKPSIGLELLDSSWGQLQGLLVLKRMDYLRGQLQGLLVLNRNGLPQGAATGASTPP
jgi:hypothetical protein